VAEPETIGVVCINCIKSIVYIVAGAESGMVSLERGWWVAQNSRSIINHIKHLGIAQNHVHRMYTALQKESIASLPPVINLKSSSIKEAAIGASVIRIVAGF
jgi:hypothetical protein